MEAVKTNLFMSSALVRLKNNPGYFFSVFTLTPGLWFGSRFLVLCKSKLGLSQMYTHLYSNIRLFGSIVMAAIQKKEKIIMIMNWFD